MKARSYWQRILGGIALILTIIFISACGEVDATWKVVKVVSKSEAANFHIETIDARNCSEAEKKTCGCTANAGRTISVKAQAGVQVNMIALPVAATVDLEAEFGLSSSQEHGSTETLALAPAPLGQVFRYKVRKTYRTFTGKVRVRSPVNEEREVDYAFQASCT